MTSNTPPAQLTDEQLVAQITSIDQELYVHIVERYQAPLLRYVRTIVFDAQGAADITQNAFIKAFQNLRSFKIDRKFSSWLYRIAHNEAINYIKKHKRELQPDDEAWFDSLADTREGIAKVLDDQKLQNITAQAVQQLPLKYSEPLILHVFEHKSYQEVADILRLPTATVGTRINRAKAKLKSILQGRKEELL